MQFQPRYLLETELASYGLPEMDEQRNIMSLVDSASSFVDEYCGKTDTDGNGSLAFTTYSERVLLPAGRNLFRVSFRPLAVVSPSVVTILSASGQYYYTGALANEILRQGTNTVTPLISASGRYGYGRRGQQAVYPDANYGANILQIAAFFGGPPNFTAIDVSACDYDVKSGEIWVPAGLYTTQYTEVVITYNAGFDPRDMPRGIKHATAALVRNLLARGGGTTGLRGLSSGRVNAQFTDELVDPTIDRWLQPYKTVVAY